MLAENEGVSMLTFIPPLRQNGTKEFSPKPGILSDRILTCIRSRIGHALDLMRDLMLVNTASAALARNCTGCFLAAA